MSALARTSQTGVVDRPSVIQYFPDRTFHPVSGRYPEKMKILAEIFNRILKPLYGSQEKALQQIRESSDRKCFLLYEGKTPVGVLAFKSVLTNEFADYGVRDSIEIKSLFVDQSKQNSGRGLGSALIDKVKEEAEKLRLGHKGIHVTVSETKAESLMFFKKKGFDIVHEWKGRYLKGITEYLLSCPAGIQKVEESQTLSAAESYETPELLHIIHNAHLDDVHALKKLSDGTFVSGSKDNCLYKWSKEGKIVKIVDEVEPTQQDERNWITAVEVLNDEYWLSGERNGKVVLWKTSGEYIREIKLKLPTGRAHFSKRQNTTRVNCLGRGINPNKPGFFVGFPTMFDEFNLIEGRTEASTKVHKNDWVYCVHPLSERDVVVVTGCTADVWHKEEDVWRHHDNFIAEGGRYQGEMNGRRKWLRPFISSLSPLHACESQFAFSFFDGSVKVVDLVNKAVVNEWREHAGKVWTVEAVAQNLFASSGEDHAVKLWDVREKASVHTIADHVGEVTSLLSLDEHTLVVGACPKDAIRGSSGAEIRFYDTRK